jgi:2'-5' RNA ligase
VAVDPPAWACERLVEWARGVVVAARAAGGSLRLLDASLLHLTLCFLGSRPVGEIDALGAALAVGGEHSCALSVGAPLWLPPRRPHTLAVEIRDHGEELRRLREQVAGALAAASGWEPERRRFRPHVTVARGRRGAGGELALAPTPSLDFTPRAVVLYRSWLTPEGASYEALASSELIPAGR